MVYEANVRGHRDDLVDDPWSRSNSAGSFLYVVSTSTLNIALNLILIIKLFKPVNKSVKAQQILN